MGQTSGKTSTDDLNGFNREEYKLLVRNLKPLVAGEGMPELKKLLEKSHLSSTLSERFCKILQQDSSTLTLGKNKNAPVTSWSGILRLLSKILRGNSEGLSEIIVRLGNGSDLNDTVTAEQLFKFLCDICKCYYKMIEKTPPAESWRIGDNTQQLMESDTTRLVHNQLFSLLNKDSELKDINGKAATTSLPAVLYTKEDLETWLTRTPIMLNILETVFNIAFQMKNIATDVNYEEAENYSELLPMCHGFNWNRYRPLLCPSDVLVLNQNLPSSLRSRWRLLFSSSQHGESFSQMLGRVTDQGPTLLVVRDKEGTMFGGFASESWNLKPQFTGCSQCFLFTLRPKIGVYNSTGFNEHYMYLNLNQQTMPNGLGMGGQLEYFGLWLDGEYGLGKCSKSCTTYCSPQLCSTEEFTFTDLEVWGVGPKPKSPEEDDDGVQPVRHKKSVLDKLDPGLKSVMEMAGRELKSEALREEDARDQRP